MIHLCVPSSLSVIIYILHQVAWLDRTVKIVKKDANARMGLNVIMWLANVHARLDIQDSGAKMVSLIRVLEACSQLDSI